MSMKKNILKTFIILALGAGISGCGNSFLETNYYKGIDVETGLSTVDNISTALNGTYYDLFYYYLPEIMQSISVIFQLI